MKLVRMLVVAAFVSVFASWGLAEPSEGVPQFNPRVDVSSSTGQPGDVVQVQLSGWPTGSVTVSICGNGAVRGSQDCDQVGSQGVGVSAGVTATIYMKVAVPPAPCPCVVRATTPTGNFVRTVSFAIPGVAVAPVVEPASGGPHLVPVKVEAKILPARRSFPSSWAAPFGLSSRKTVELTITNDSTTPVTGVHLVASVGRGASSVSPGASRRMAPLAAGEVRRVVVQVEVAAPAWGDYVVVGSVYGDGVAAPFKTATSNDPWALELLVPILLIVAARLARRREQRLARESLQESSLPIEDPYRERSSVDAWIPLDTETPAGCAAPGSQALEAAVAGANGWR